MATTSSRNAAQATAAGGTEARIGSIYSDRARRPSIAEARRSTHFTLENVSLLVGLVVLGGGRFTLLVCELLEMAR